MRCEETSKCHRMRISSQRVWLVLLGLLLLSLPVGYAAATNGHWELVQNSHGIKVWVLDIPGQDLPGFRGQATIDASIEDIVEVMLDVPHHTDWMWRVREAKQLSGREMSREEDHGLLYTRIHAPWPVWDRDVVLD